MLKRPLDAYEHNLLGATKWCPICYSRAAVIPIVDGEHHHKWCKHCGSVFSHETNPPTVYIPTVSED